MSTDVLEKALARLATESRAPELAEIDTMPLRERCAVQNSLDSAVAVAIGRELESIARAIEAIVTAFKSGGRLVYVGAGTSGRLGVLDASECPPTFGTAPDIVQAIIAGGEAAIVRAVEGVEDDQGAGAAAIDRIPVTANDCVVGITASGRTPFVLGAVGRANEIGAATIGVTNNRPSEIAALAHQTIAVVVGPEMIAGSTRLKAGTAQKLVLNMLSTQAMIETGKTFGSAMVELTATNDKLSARARRLVREITGASDDAAKSALAAAGGSVKVAIVMLVRDVDPDAARARLAQARGNLRSALYQSGIAG